MNPMEPTVSWTASSLEGRLVAFEAAWRDGLVPDLSSYLVSLAGGTGSLVADECSQFVALDLEYRWRSANLALTGGVPARPRLEHYLGRLPCLDVSEQTILELTAAEYRVRRLWGDSPPKAEYLWRFPHLAALLPETLAQVDRELSDELGDEHLPTASPSEEPPTFPCAAVADRDPPPIEGLVYLGVLGRGGMGVVYKAFDLKLGREVAVKTIPTDLEVTREEHGRFREEAAAVARINHPNILTIHAVGESRGRPYLVIECLEGGTLSDRIKTGPMPARDVALLAQTLALAIQEAHDRGIIHRDLKPSNILFTASGRPKIGDFGLAKRIDDQSARTATGVILGTPSYMAPEQTLGRSREVGPAADVHALGAMIYHMLTGRPPFIGESPVETIRLVLETEPRSLRSFRPGLARDLETICLKCLEKSPVKRYSSARELALDLGRFLAGEPVRARRLGSPGRLMKWTRRHPWQSALAASVVLAVAVVLGLVARHDRALRAQILRTESKAAEARRNYLQARQTIHAMLERTGDTSLFGTPRMLDLRHDLLEHAVRFHDAILAGADLGDPLMLADAAQTLSDNSVSLLILGRSDEAIASGRRAAWLYERLNQSHPDDVESRVAWIRCLARLATEVPPKDAPNKSVLLGRKAVELADSLLEQKGDDHQLLELAAMAHHDHALALAATNHPDQAIAEYERAVELRSRIDLKAWPEAAFTLAESLTNLAVVHWTHGRFEEAEKSLRRAWDLLRGTRTTRESDRGVMALGSVATNLSGVLNSDPGKLEQSIQISGEAIGPLEAYLKHEPNDAYARPNCLRLHGNRAIALQGLGRHRESLREWTRVVELADPPVPIGYHLSVGLESIAAGDRDAAERIADRITIEPGQSIADRYNAACVLALLAKGVGDDPKLAPGERTKQAEARIAKAFEWLEATRDLGFFRDPANRKSTREDSDLAILRDRPEFQALVAEPSGSPNK